MAKDKEYWKATADKAHEVLAELRAERDERAAELEGLNNEILQWEQILTSLRPIAEGKPTAKVTVMIEEVVGLPLTDACRVILRKVNDYQTAKGIRDTLEGSGYDLTQHNNPLASIHGVLKRLFESGEAEQLEASGKTFYRWKGGTVVTPETAKLKLETFAPTAQSRKVLAEQVRAVFGTPVSNPPYARPPKKHRRYNVPPRVVKKKDE